MLKHITIEATERARDRIPLRQYHDIRRCFQELIPKLSLDGSRADARSTTRTNERGANDVMESSLFETSREIRNSASQGSKEIQPAAVSNGHDTNEEAGQVDSFRDNDRESPEIGGAVDRPKKRGRKRKRLDGDRQVKGGNRASAMGDRGGTLDIMGTQHGVEEVDVHKGGVQSEAETEDQDSHEDLVKMYKDTEAQCEHICLQLQGFEGGQPEKSAMWNAADELMENQDMAEKQVVDGDNADAELVEGDTLVDESSDQAQPPIDQAANQTRGNSSEQCQHAQDVTEEVAGPDASSLITLNIEHQAAVNHLYDMGSVGILQKLSSSLETMRSSGHDAPHSIHFTTAVLSEEGIVEVHAHAESKEDMERLSRIRG